MISEDEYIQEWMVSILKIRPELSAQVAYVLARTSIDMVDDLALNYRISARPTVQSDLLQLVNAVLAILRRHRVRPVFCDKQTLNM